MDRSQFVKSRAHAAVLAARAYVYGFPIVLMERSRALFHDSATGAPPNTLVHLQGVPDHTFRAVVRPNQDTIYSAGFLDLRDGPLSFHLPGVPERRFVSFTLLDAWSNAFASLRPTPSARGPETTASRFVIVGPRSAAPAALEGATLVRAPTDLVWVIGRVELLSHGDLGRVRDPVGRPARSSRRPRPRRPRRR